MQTLFERTDTVFRAGTLTPTAARGASFPDTGWNTAGTGPTSDPGPAQRS